MTAPNPVLALHPQVDGRTKERLGRGAWVWCPGCDMAHRPVIADEDGHVPRGPVWEFDGNLTAPTFSPSILVHDSVHLCGRDVHHRFHCRRRGNCHSFIRAGQWEFLRDSAHHLAGQTVPMVPLPDWLVRSQ